MNLKNSKIAASDNTLDTSQRVVEEVIERKLADITTILHPSNGAKSRLHEDILCMVERSLVKIALERNNNVKAAAAAYLGINRNTFQKKMIKYGIGNSEDEDN